VKKLPYGASPKKNGGVSAKILIFTEVLT
jgi:hypothetical protein